MAGKSPLYQHKQDYPYGKLPGVKRKQIPCAWLRTPFAEELGMKILATVCIENVVLVLLNHAEQGRSRIGNLGSNGDSNALAIIID